MAGEHVFLCRDIVDYHGDLVRNIKTIRVSQDLFDDLAETPQERRVAVTAEYALRIPTAQPAVTRPFDYGSVISYSFDSAHWHATRLSAGTDYGVWYGSLEVKTTVYETAFHWHRFLMESFSEERSEIIGERRLFDVRCDGLLVDTRKREQFVPQLISRRDYTFTRELGRYLLEQGQNGVLLASARCTGVNAAILNPARLSNVRDKLQLTYRCVPVRDRIAVEKVQGKTWFTLKPGALY